MELNPVGLIAALAVLVVVLGRSIVRALRNAKRRSRTREEAQEWSRKQREGKPPLIAADAEDLKRWLAAERLPYAELTAEAEPPASNIASRLGGSAFLPDGTDWPTDSKGRPYLFVAQVNFAEMPRLPDHPESGLLSVFIADDDLWGANFDDGEKGDFRIMYLADVATPGRLVQRPGGAAEYSPFQNGDAELRGRALRFGGTDMMTPSGSDWRVEQKWPAWWAREGGDGFTRMLEPEDRPWGPFAYVGGQPRFTQNDPRGKGNPFDRVLLQIGSDDNIMWGDVGEAVFMIRREDLIARDFSRVMFSWDCH